MVANFTHSGEVVLDGNGDGTVLLDIPPQYKVRRYVKMTVTISTGQQSLGGEVRVFAGLPVEINFIDGSETPWLDTATWALDQAVIRAPQQLRAVFSSCDPGATARLHGTYVEEIATRVQA